MNLYHVYHQRPREVAPGVGEIHVNLERVEIARATLAGLRDVINFVGGPTDVEVIPIGNSAMVCGMCQSALPVKDDDLCHDCTEIRDYEAEAA